MNSQMTVEMNNAHWPVCTVDGAKKRKGNGMISAQRNNTRQSLAVLGEQTWYAGIGLGSAREDAIVS
jgi:hypothetical protein